MATPLHRRVIKEVYQNWVLEHGDSDIPRYPRVAVLQQHEQLSSACSCDLPGDPSTAQLIHQGDNEAANT